MMTDYNHITASHYAAYRPPLHEIILQKVLSEKYPFSNGLDIGCGTGYSALALTDYCSKVIGIDPSQSMLDRVTEHPKINYKKGTGENIPLADNSVDVVTLAGSLFYMDVDQVASEIKRVCRDEAVVIPYDFVVLLDDVLALFEIKKEKAHSGYDPYVNFSGIHFFEEIYSEQEKINLNLSPVELAHVLLSDHYQYKAFSEKYSQDQPFDELVNDIRRSIKPIRVQADIFYSTYRLISE